MLEHSISYMIKYVSPASHKYFSLIYSGTGTFDKYFTLIPPGRLNHITNIKFVLQTYLSGGSIASFKAYPVNLPI